jgi:hypothetical protein
LVVSVLSVGFDSTSGVGVGVALVGEAFFLVLLLLEPDFFFVVVAGFFAVSVLDLPVAA